MQFDPGMEYRPADYRASQYGQMHKIQGGLMGGMPPPGLLPPGSGSGMGQHGMGGVHRGVGIVPGILPPPSQQVNRSGMNINPAAQGNTQGILMPGIVGNGGVTGSGVSGGKPNPGPNLSGINQPGNSVGGPGSIGQNIPGHPGQNIPPQNKDDKS